MAASSRMAQPRSRVCGSVGPGASTPVGSWRASKVGRSDRIGGSSWKLWSGGGEVVDHSRLLPSHGSAGAGRPRRSDLNTFHRNGRVDAPTRNAPTVEARLAGSHR